MSNLPQLFQPREWKPYPQHSNRCSQIGFPCALAGFYARVHWQDAKPPSPELLQIFDWGSRLQSIVMAEIHTRGWDVITTERPVQWPDLQLTGRLDLLVRVDGEILHLDIKTMSARVFPSINSLSDLRRAEHAYQRGYITQATLYAIHEDIRASRTGLLCFNKQTAESKIVAWDPLEAEQEADEAFARCEQINRAIDKRSPDGLESPGPHCDDCSYTHLCSHYSVEAAGYTMQEAEVTEAVAELQRLKSKIDLDIAQIKQIEKDLKSHWATQEPGKHICGEWVAKVTRVADKEIPAKAAYTRRGYSLVTYKRL